MLTLYRSTDRPQHGANRVCLNKTIACSIMLPKREKAVILQWVESKKKERIICLWRCRQYGLTVLYHSKVSCSQDYNLSLKYYCSDIKKEAHYSSYQVSWQLAWQFGLWKCLSCSQLKFLTQQNPTDCLRARLLIGQAINQMLWPPQAAHQMTTNSEILISHQQPIHCVEVGL